MDTEFYSVYDVPIDQLLEHTVTKAKELLTTSLLDTQSAFHSSLNLREMLNGTSNNLSINIPWTLILALSFN